MSNVTMADLTNGTRIHHLKWDMNGTIRQYANALEIRWDDVFGEIEISDEGAVYPEDVELIREAI